MPSAYEVKKTLHISTGEVLGQFEVVDSRVDVQAKKARELYKISIKLWLKASGHKRNLADSAKSALLDVVNQHKILYSAYGSPYELKLDHVSACMESEEEGEDQEGNVVVQVEATGTATRRRDIPSLAKQQEAKEHQQEEHKQKKTKKGANHVEEEPELQGYRVTKAHFKSGHCPVCGKEFIPGEKIAKPQGDQHRGGWVHVGCIGKQQPQQEEQSHGPE